MEQIVLHKPHVHLNNKVVVIMEVMDHVYGLIIVVINIMIVHHYNLQLMMNVMNLIINVQQMELIA